ncbi:MAG: 50S ribosomal protein L4 [Candidatus Acidiferrales bacterium]
MKRKQQAKDTTTMAVVDIMNLEGKSVGQIDLPDAVFGARVNPNLLHETVRWYLAAQHRGTHKTKGRGEVSGSGRKLWKQKGTGRARVGSIRSSIWRKGGTVHGPVPHSYSYRLPRKMLLGALRSALSAKLAEQKLTVVDGWQLDSHKSKPFRQALSRLDGATKTMLLVEIDANRNLELASRNLEGVKLVAPHALQPYDLLRHDRLVLSKDAAVRLGTTLGPRTSTPASDVVTIETVAPAEQPKAEGKKKSAGKKTSKAKK